MNNLIETLSLYKAYKGGRKQVFALRDVTLGIKEGDYLAIVGPSGAGKTTLLNMLSGLDDATEGNVLFEGENISEWGENKVSLWRSRNIGFVFQFYHLIEELTVIENIALPSLLLHKSTKMSFKAARKLLEYLGIKNKGSYVPSQLSGGEKQKVAIARALINEPRVIFCDEPTGNLDKDSSEKVIALLENLNADKNKALVIVTHNFELAQRALQIIHIKNGGIEKIEKTHSSL